MNHPPFTCTYSPEFAELLAQLNCSISISTYQAGKIVFLSPKPNGGIVQLPRTFVKAMGIALKGERMAVACKDEVILLKNSKHLAQHFPRKAKTYDALFMPRATYYTGALDIHDLDWTDDDRIIGVNTSFSCIVQLDEHFSFTPIWKPYFISKLASEDRCHLNGMAIEDGKAKYVTAFNQGDQAQSWRAEVTTGGIVMDVASNEIIAKNIPMPHSPRMINGSLYLLLSATGELVKLDVTSGKYEVVTKIGGFVRGLSSLGDYAFVGLSKLRKESSSFSKLKIAKAANTSGIVAIHLPTGKIVGKLIYQTSVDEIYDVQVLPGMLRPGILNTIKEDYKMGLMTPDSTYWAQPEKP